MDIFRRAVRTMAWVLGFGMLIAEPTLVVRVIATVVAVEVVCTLIPAIGRKLARPEPELPAGLRTAYYRG